MFEQTRISAKSEPEFLMNAKNIDYLTGNATLDNTKLTNGQTIKRGTAIFKNETSGLFELVATDTPATMKLPCLTRDTVTVNTDNKYTHVSAVTSGYPIKELCTGVTSNFESANKQFIYY